MYLLILISSNKIYLFTVCTQVLCMVQLKGNVALARYCLARFSKVIHSIFDTHQRSLAVYRVLINRISLAIYPSITRSTTRSKTITRKMTR